MLFIRFCSYVHLFIHPAQLGCFLFLPNRLWDFYMMDPLLPGGMGWDCIWVTPVVKNFYGPDLGQSGYGYHGYWTEDFTQIDPNFGTADDLKELVQETHKHGSLGKTW